MGFKPVICCVFAWSLVGSTCSDSLRFGFNELMRFSFPFTSLVGLPPFFRRLQLIAIDAILLPLAVWLSYWLRLAHPFHPSFMISGTWLFIVVNLVGLPLYAFTGQYKGLTRYVGSVALYRLSVRNGLLSCCWQLGLMFRMPMPPAAVDFVVVVVDWLHWAVRFALRDVLLNMRSIKHKHQTRVAIYGAGEAGAQLAAALRFAGNHRIVTFLDDNPAFWSRSINGVAIQPPQVLRDLGDSVDQVFVAIPSLSRSERRRIVDQLQSFGIAVLQVPSVDDLTSGRATIDALRPIAIEDLLGRDVVPATHSF